MFTSIFSKLSIFISILFIFISAYLIIDIYFNFNFLSFIIDNQIINNYIIDIIVNLDNLLQLNQKQHSIYFFLFIFIFFLLIKNTVSLSLQKNKIEKKQEEIKHVLNSQSNIIIITNGKKIIDGNKKFFSFLNIYDINAFDLKYKGFEKLFINEKNYFSYSNNWIEKVISIQRKKTPIKVKMLDGKQNVHIFLLKLDFLPNEFEERLFILSLIDITKEEQNNRKIREQSFFTKNILESSPTPMFYINNKQRFLGVNKKFYELFNINKEKNILNKTFFEILEEKIAEKLEEKCSLLLNNPNKTIYLDFKYKSYDEIFYLHFTFKTFKNSKNNVLGIICVINDMTKQKDLEFKLKNLNSKLENKAETAIHEKNESEKKYQYLFNKIPESILIYYIEDNTPSNFIEVNKKACELFKYQQNEFLQKEVRDLFDASDFAQLPILNNKVFEKNYYNLEVSMFDSNNQEILTDLTAITFKYKNKNAVFLTVKNITEQKRLEDVVIKDHMTKCYNKMKFEESMEQSINFSKRNDNIFSLLIFDIDKFKRVNDTYGHQVGDDVLIEFAKRIRQVLKRSSDLFCRIGGEEFTIIVTDTDLEGALKLGEDIRKHIESTPFDVVGTITCSIGVTQFYKEKNDTMKKMLNRSDMALYECKENGRNQVRTVDHNENYEDKGKK